MPDHSLPTRSELEEIIAAFNPDGAAYNDLRAKKYPENLPDRATLQQYSESKNRTDFKWSPYTLENPYRMRCGIFSEAFYRHLTTHNIVALVVGSPDHEYLLIPAQHHGKAVTLIFDPTAEQLYEKHDTTYFLGIPEELATFHRQKVAAGHFHELHSERALGMEGTYYDGLHVIAMSSRVFHEPAVDALATLFCPRYSFSPEDFKSWLRNTRSIAAGESSYATDPFVDSPKIDVGAITLKSTAASLRESTAPAASFPAPRQMPPR